MLLPDVAEWFQSRGFHVLIYDPRSIGDSDGLPRNQINPLQQSEDLSDIVTHVSALPGVDSSRILLWGMSFGGTVSGCAAAVDRRVKGLVMVCPILRFYDNNKRDKAFALLTKDRQSQLRGNEPLTLAPFNRKGENPIGMAGSGGPGGLEAYQFMNAVIDRGAPNFRNKITLQSYHKLAMWRPKELLQEMLDTTPVMVITPELDTMSPPEDQKALFDAFPQQKEFFLAKGKGHLTVLSGEGSEDILQAQEAFLRAAAEGRLKR
jgi:pimeloyl-ACP methyl ester carboxylesterase